jgi:hypothetical protein
LSKVARFHFERFDTQVRDVDIPWQGFLIPAVRPVSAMSGSLPTDKEIVQSLSVELHFLASGSITFDGRN